MKKLIVMTALAIVSSFSFADEAVTAEAYSNALQVVRAWNKEHRKAPKIQEDNSKKKVRMEYAHRLHVSEQALAKMERRIQVLNATTNRPVESVIESYKAKAGFRTKLKEAEDDAKKARDIEKAAKKSTKAREKIIKTIEQAKKKSSDEDEIAFYDSLEELINSK